MTAHRVWKIGTHDAYMEPPNLLRLRFRGATTLEDCIRLTELYQEVSRQQPFILVADMREGTTSDVEGRRYISEHFQSEWFVDAIFIGSRLVNKASLKGLALVNHQAGSDSNPWERFHFVSTEEEARALLGRLHTQRLLEKVA
jgi:hypothetical protein